MKNLHMPSKAKMIVSAVLFVIVFSLGAAARPGIDLFSEIIGGLFGNDTKVYVAPPTEYEAKVDTLWKSERHQAVCKANAATVVSLQLTRQYLDEYEKQAVLAQWETPLSEIKTIKAK